MLPVVDHRFVAEVQAEGGAPITTAVLQPDWIPLVEWGRWQRVRKPESEQRGVPRQARISPHWDGRSGAPYVSELAISFEESEADRPESIPVQYFAGAVQHQVSALVEQGRIQKGAQLSWRICAFPSPPPQPSSSVKETFRVEESTPIDFPLATRTLAARLGPATRHGPERTGARALDVEVLFAPRVLEEASTAAVAAGELEAGGILLGQVARDADTGELVLAVTAQVPALEAIADDASLRFTPDTWKAVHAAISLRRAGETILGWYHSHPVKHWPCRHCPPERRAQCPSNRPFFSGMDVAFHRTAFQGAHNIALLLSFHGDRTPRIDVFGWRQGLIAARDYHTIEVSP